MSEKKRNTQLRWALCTRNNNRWFNYVCLFFSECWWIKGRLYIFSFLHIFLHFNCGQIATNCSPNTRVRKSTEYLTKVQQVRGHVLAGEKVAVEWNREWKSGKPSEESRGSLTCVKEQYPAEVTGAFRSKMLLPVLLYPPEQLQIICM